MIRNRELRILPNSSNPIYSRNVAAVYNQAGHAYADYADGDPVDLFRFGGVHGYADQQVWKVIEEKLASIRAAGADGLSVLDAGCGPGTWLRRIVIRARQLGFRKIAARGFDIALTQVRFAQQLTRDLRAQPGIDLNFAVEDLLNRLPESDGSVDLTLCLYSVLSHLKKSDQPKVTAELARITRGHLVTTVRAVGSTPTAFVEPIERVRHLKLDHGRDRCEVEFGDGCRVALSFHLFSACELEQLFGRYFEIDTLCGLDIFHNRFVPDQRWNPAGITSDEKLLADLMQLESTFANDPAWIDRATHLLLAGRPRREHPSSQQSGSACQPARRNRVPIPRTKDC
jgi:SAM-dependent methyltransferase